MKKVILPYVEKVKKENELSLDQPSLVIFNMFKGHRFKEVDTLLGESKLLKVLVPSNSMDWLQPLDLTSNKTVKDHLMASFRS